VIELSGVSLSFGDVSVLDGVDLSVEPGEFVALVGPNGAGKTTLLRTINGILEPDGGRVEIDGTALSDLSSKAVSRRVATVPQDTHLGFSFTAEQIVEMGRTPHRSRLDWDEGDEAVERALSRTEMLDLRDRAVDDLSGGERQRVLLARALAQEPDALLLDEPTASLDINHQVRVLGLVASLVGEGQTAVAAIHDLDLAARFCDRLVLLSDGGIRADGTPAEVLRDSAVESAFGTRTAVSRNPVTGTPTVAAVEERTEPGRVHVAGGGVGGQKALAALWRAGYDVTLGPVPAGDTAARTADQFGCETVTAPPFRSLDGERRQRALELCRSADAAVFPGGPGSSALAGESDLPPRISAEFADGADSAAHAARALGDGGSTDAESPGSVETVETESELLAAVRDALDGSGVAARAREKRGE
jgi:iron complex transport system ATP-binding protein